MDGSSGSETGEVEVVLVLQWWWYGLGGKRVKGLVLFDRVKAREWIGLGVGLGWACVYVWV